MALDLTALEGALAELEIFLALCEPATPSGAPKSSQARAFEAVSIQAFEFTYELCCKMLKRYLDAILPSKSLTAGSSFPELIRIGFGEGIVRSEWQSWAVFRDMLNITGHTYSPKQAARVLAAIPGFVDEARHLLRYLQAHPAP